MKKLAKSTAVAAAVAGAVWALHALAPLKTAIPIDIALILAYAVIMSRPEKVSVSRHLHRTAASFVLILVTAGLRAIGGIGFLALATFLAFTYFGQQSRDAAETAKNQVTRAVVGQVKHGAKDNVDGKVGDLLSNLGDDIARAKARHAARTVTPSSAM